MKKYLTAFTMTQSMFCALPFPCKLWKEEVRPYMLLFLPVIGLEIGGFWWVINYLLYILHVPSLAYGLGMCAFPYLLSGFIHLDGFLDVTDAISSWRPLDKRRAILKDSNVGAFAVIWCVFILLAGFAFFSSVSEEANSWCLIFIPVISRCCSALAVMRLKPMNTSQYANSITYPKGCMVILMILLLVFVVLGCILLGKYAFVIVAEVIGYGVALWRSYRCLEGMNGDISGFCLTISELCAVAVYALI